MRTFPVDALRTWRAESPPAPCSERKNEENCQIREKHPMQMGNRSTNAKVATFQN